MPWKKKNERNIKITPLHNIDDANEIILYAICMQKAEKKKITTIPDTNSRSNAEQKSNCDEQNRKCNITQMTL